MTKVVVLTKAQASPWTLPADWTDAGHTVELLGAGGNGAAGTTANGSGAGGGGGGGYCKLVHSSGSLGTPGVSTVLFKVAVGGAGNGAANDTQWLSSSGAGNYYRAGSGGNGSGLNGGAAGVTGSAVGTPAITYTVSGFAGGSVGANTSTPVSGGGGGAAAGPNGAGAIGRIASGTAHGSGGAGCNGGISGTPGPVAGGLSGVGGNNRSGAGGGAASDGIASYVGGNGSNGGGGAGGFKGDSAGQNSSGGNGSTEVIAAWGGSYGPGGGGGGGGANAVNSTGITTKGGNGGPYGGGGGGGAYCPNSGAVRTGGTGGDGLIIITYTEAVTAVALTATNLAVSAPTFDAPSLAAIPNLTAADFATTAAALSASDLGQTHVLADSSLTIAPYVINQPAFLQAHILQATFTLSAPTVNLGVLGQHHTLAAAALATSTPEIGVGITVQDLVLGDYVLDFGLGKLQEADKLLVCTYPPQNYAQAISSAVGEVAANFSAPQAIAGGRKVTHPAVNNCTVTGTGKVTRWAAVNTPNSRLLAHGDIEGDDTVNPAVAWRLQAITIIQPNGP